MSRAARLVLLTQLVGNAVLLWMGYYWLGLAESRASTLLWSAFIALATVSLACWLHGATFTFFRGAGHRPAPFRSTLRNLPPLVLSALAVLTLYLLVARWSDSLPAGAARVASFLTLTFRKPVKPATALRVFGDAFWLLQWVVLPVLLIPLFAGVSSRGWRGFREFGGLARKRLYWLQAPFLLICAVWLPLRLLGWVPHVGGFALETISFVIRAAVAYLLFVAACLLLAFLTARGKAVQTGA